MLQPARLHFRDFSPADLFVVAHAMGDARLTAFYGLETAHSDARVIAQEQLDWYASVASEGSGWWQAVLLDGAVIAAVGIYDHDDEADSADLGYWLLPDHWGRGWMDQALRQWLPSAFAQLGLHSVVAMKACCAIAASAMGLMYRCSAIRCWSASYRRCSSKAQAGRPSRTWQPCRWSLTMPMACMKA